MSLGLSTLPILLMPYYWPQAISVPKAHDCIKTDNVIPSFIKNSQTWTHRSHDLTKVRESRLFEITLNYYCNEDCHCNKQYN